MEQFDTGHSSLPLYKIIIYSSGWWEEEVFGVTVLWEIKVIRCDNGQGGPLSRAKNDYYPIIHVKPLTSFKQEGAITWSYVNISLTTMEEIAGREEQGKQLENIAVTQSRC